MRQLVLVLHILGAALWIGGGVIGVLGRNNLTAQGSAVALRWMAFEETLGKAFYPAVALLTLLSGITLVLISPAYGFLDSFVLLGFSVFLISAVTNPAFAAKQDARAVAALVDGDDDGALAHFSKTRPFHVFEIALLVVTLVAMVYRWGA